MFYDQIIIHDSRYRRGIAFLQVLRVEKNPSKKPTQGTKSNFHLCLWDDVAFCISKEELITFFNSDWFIDLNFPIKFRLNCRTKKVNPLLFSQIYVLCSSIKNVQNQKINDDMICLIDSHLLWIFFLIWIDFSFIFCSLYLFAWYFEWNEQRKRENTK